MVIFQIQQVFLGRQPAAIAGERAVAADDTMARHEYADGVSTVGVGDGTHSMGHPDASGEVGVGNGRAVRDGEQCLPYFLLELGAYKKQREVKGFAFMSEIFVQLPACHVDNLGRLLPEGTFQDSLQAAVHNATMAFHVPIAKAELTRV